jgi:hypothetical protein
MKFPYSSLIATEPGTSDFLVIRRPEIPVTIIGPAGWVTLIGLVDSGSDHTIFPRSVADYLNIRLSSAAASSASAFGGHSVQLEVGEVHLRLEAERESLTWPAQVCFYDFAAQSDECVILGHSGFLDFLVATFDGKLGVLTLLATDEMPATS